MGSNWMVVPNVSSSLTLHPYVVALCVFWFTTLVYVCKFFAHTCWCAPDAACFHPSSWSHGLPHGVLKRQSINQYVFDVLRGQQTRFASHLKSVCPSMLLTMVCICCSEIQPLEVRAAACSFNVAVNMLFTFVIGQCFVTMLCTMEWGVI